MKLAVASGKGGTGKTTLACAIALCAKGPVTLLDCDVEEPNCRFFIHSEPERTEPVNMPVPQADAERCIGCGECGRVCRFGAIAALGKHVMVFPELCHGCGACTRICPTGALREIDQPIGSIESGRSGTIAWAYGRLDIGQAMAPPVIRATLKKAPNDGLTVVDCPPGTACPFVTAVKGCDAALLVTEPTPFGLHDLKLAVETLREIGTPFAVAVNRANTPENRIAAYCSDEGIPLLLQIPEERRVAEAYSRGRPLTDVLPELRAPLAALPATLEKTA
jgi:MinD superfamily P-loop ATPase